ncbi:MAG: 2,5-diamino-6-(ribosylamino)-4(3H)-pyrimidinone 5'-phosphate reductase [Chloroflexi bacterium]|nr:2,5-diamino-6-(ribosylamino)-4(3H)-pyrimidinone 5'-phosphate reductase [Chloroflexota bacterium]
MNRPYTFINVAMTADGKIDTAERKGAAISSKEDKARVDQLRAEADAVLVGGKTLLEELPKLTVKSESLREGRIRQGRSPNPIKVGVVTVADIPVDSDFVKAGETRVVIFTTSQTSNEQIERLRSHGVEVYTNDAPRVDLMKMISTLKEMGVDRLMVEGGGTMNFELMRLGLVDELMMYIAPMVFGGAGAPTPADGVGVPRNTAIEMNLLDVVRWEDGGIVLKYKIK